MNNEEFKELMGVVEVDETYVGGKDKNRHWNKKSHKTGGEASGKVPIIGAISRKGNVVCRAIENTRRETLNTRNGERPSDVAGNRRTSGLWRSERRVSARSHPTPRQRLCSRERPHQQH